MAKKKNNNKKKWSRILLMSALFSDAPTSTKNGFTLFM